MSPKPKPLTLGRVLAHCAVGLACAAGLVLLIPLAGGSISLRSALAAGPSGMGTNSDALIFWGTRVPRVLMAMLAGGSLALCGLVFQSVLRNPLAEPYILGISGGAALGKVIAVILALQGLVTFFALTPVICFLGALAPLLLLHTISARSRRFTPVTILLGGVMLNVFFSSVILLLQYFANFTQVRLMWLWMMGGLDVVGYGELRVVAPLALVLFAVILTQTRAMNLLSLGHATAAHLGIDVKRSVNILIWASAVLTSAVVAVAGPIGFVGLIVPHSLRLMAGADNRLLAPLSVLYGGCFLAACDFLGWRAMELAQRAGVPLAETTEIPVGVITALLGGPFFLYLLVSRRSKTT